MQNKHKGLLLVLLSVVLVDIAQILLKYGMTQIGSLDFSSGIFSVFVHIFSNVYVILGVLLFVSSSVGWLVALSKMPLSLGYPILSIGYVIVSVLSWIFFGESLSFLRIIGLAVIVGGVFLLSRT